MLSLLVSCFSEHGPQLAWGCLESKLCLVTVALENVPFAQMPVPGLLPALAPDTTLHNAILPAQPAQPVFLQAHTREPTRALCSKAT